MAAKRQKLSAYCVYYYVSDMDRAVKFYTKTMGLPLKIRFENHWAEVDAGPITIGLHPTADGKRPSSGGGTVSFSVKNFDSLIAGLRKKGARMGRVHTPDRGKSITVRDPDGNQIHIVEFTRKWMKANR